MFSIIGTPFLYNISGENYIQHIIALYCRSTSGRPEDGSNAHGGIP